MADELLIPQRARPGEAAAYFRAHVDDETDECIIWPYGTYGDRGDGRTYGAVKIDGRNRGVHHVACERRHGPMPQPGMLACHAPVICHTALCFNGRHLSWETPKTNTSHRVLDGTLRNGEQHHQAKLTWSMVDEIRARYSLGGISQRALGVEFGVSESAITHVVNGYTWRRSA